MLPEISMRRPFLASSTLLVLVSAGLVALGIAVNDDFAPSVRTILALCLVVTGLVGVVSSVGDRSADSIRLATKRWWTFAFAIFLPYGLATAPSSEQAAAVGDVFSGSLALATLEATAGAAVLCAVAVTVLHWFARYGIYPGRPAPEERILSDE